MDRYISQRRSEGAVEGTIYKELVTLRTALKLARRAGLWRGDPPEVFPVAFAPEYKPRERFLCVEELQKLLAQLTPDRAARVAFIVATSANWTESDKALRADVDLKKRTVLIRGTKRRTGWRTVPLVAEWQRSLVEHPLKYAEGEDGALFARWSNVRRDLIEACDKAKFDTCTPNDLRRTCATWLRQQGAPPDLIAPVMGHADTRMVERVYGRLPTQDLAARLSAAIGQSDCSVFAADSGELGGFNGSIGQGADREGGEIKGNWVPRDRIELSTRGFSVLVHLWPRPRKYKANRQRGARTAAYLHQPAAYVVGVTQPGTQERR